ncbi:MAG: hypothetical protein F6K30_17730 [Cyanothece sp. SIO2G6]|nr:hypothetical protein [Cyanothece sp. SIO2G6]
MPSEPQRYRWTAIGILVSGITIPTLPMFYLSHSLADTAVFAAAQTDPLSAQAITQTIAQNTDTPPDLNWGEPGGSQLVMDMADDLLEFYQWGEPGGSRAGSVCTIAPYSERLESIHGVIEVWSDRPLMIWQNRGENPASRVAISDLGTYLSNQTVEPTDTTIRYDGEPLQPGQFYDLIFLDTANDDTLVSFSTLSATDRDAVSTELAQLEAQVIASGATEEELALWRSRFFIQHDLRLLYDGLDALFSVENPSPELVQRQQELLMSLCVPTQKE